MDNEPKIINNNENTKPDTFNGAYTNANFIVNIGFFAKKSPVYGLMIFFCVISWITFAVSMSMQWFIAAGICILVFILCAINTRMLSKKIKTNISVDESNYLNQKMTNAANRSVSAQMKAAPYIIVATIIIVAFLVKFS